MPPVTICIPAWRSAPFIGQTLSSLAAQTYTDFRVLLALEPEGAQETVVAMADFLRDPRFGYYINRTNHGYALNVRSVLTRVRTPFYSILPHDDMWHPRHLELLMNRLNERPDASGAYGDMFLFDSLVGARIFTIDDGPLFERLLSFFVDGADGMPWHGVGRSGLLDKPFPTNEFDGFAVECEWSLHMLLRGPVLHEPEATYLKRHRPDDSNAVSVGWRLRTTEETLRRALDHHRRSMLELVAMADVSSAQMRLLELAGETAMLRRWVAFCNGPRYQFTTREEEWAAMLLGSLEGDGSEEARAVLSTLHTALSRYWMRHKKTAVSLQHAEAAVALWPDNGDANIHVAGAYLRMGRVTDAMPPLRRAAQLLPQSFALADLQLAVARQLSKLGLAEAKRPDA